MTLFTFCPYGVRARGNPLRTYIKKKVGTTFFLMSPTYTELNFIRIKALPTAVKFRVTTGRSLTALYSAVLYLHKFRFCCENRSE